MLVIVRAFDRSLLHIRRSWQVWTRSFCICRRGFDGIPGGANSLLDFLFSRGEWIVRHVQRFVLDFGFDYAVQSQDRIGYFSFAGGVSKLLNFNPSINLLGRDGNITLVGAPPKPLPISAFGLIMGRHSLSGCLIGGIVETQEMLDFCGTHNITSDVEVIPIQKVNEAYERLLKSDVKYRFSIDMASLKSE